MDCNTVIIVIPVYKKECSASEMLSLERGLSVLRKYKYALVTPNHLDIRVYDQVFERYGVSYSHVSFDDSYFLDISGYNRLLLSYFFYKKFKEYEYMLIYQLDAYVFADCLEHWCCAGYDYVGAPIIGHFSDTVFSNVMRVGNGGFSLRRIAPVLDFFNSKKNVFTPSQICERINLKMKPYTRIFVLLMMMFGWHNKPKVVAARWRYNEDDFWSGLLDNSRFALKKPSPKEAMNFSFERFPSSLYKLNEGQLPFGCHAWQKYEYESFWYRFIGR